MNKSLYFIVENTVLYGTSWVGGAHAGGGSAFAISNTYTNPAPTSNPLGFPEGSVHDFDSRLSNQPFGSLVKIGNVLYGTTYQNDGDNGAIFQVNTDGTNYQIIHSFAGTDGGANPYAGLTLSADGSTLYGTTVNGGTGGFGIIFSFIIAGPIFTRLHSFGGGNDGAYPFAEMTLDSVNGILYGVTSGTSILTFLPNSPTNTEHPTLSGYGTVFAYTISTPTFTTLYSFQGTAADGGFPYGKLLLLDSKLYGVTSGVYFSSSSVINQGTIFTIPAAPVTTNTITTIFVFNDYFNKGGFPIGGLVEYNSRLYGTVSFGLGTFSSQKFGGIYSIPALPVTVTVSDYKIDYTFGTAATDGVNPFAQLTVYGNSLYGTTTLQGTTPATIFQFSNPGTVVATLITLFAFTNNESPRAALIF